MKMTSARYLSGSLALSALLLPLGLAAQDGDAGSGEAVRKQYITRTSPGEVTIEVRPFWDGATLGFEIAANTHSVEVEGIALDETLRLIVGDRTLEPIEAGRLRGHHARGEVRFGVTARPERFALEIRGVPDVPVRRLEWRDESHVRTAATGSGPLVAVGGIAPGGLAILHAGTLEVLRTVDGLQAVHGAAIDPEGGRAFAVNMADPERAVTIVDVATGEVERVVSLPGPGHHAAAGEGVLYVAYGTMSPDAGTPRGIAVVDPRTGETRTLPTQGTPFYLAVAPHGRLWAAVQGPEPGTGRVLGFETPGLSRVAEVEIAGTPSHLAAAADGTRLFVALVEGRVVQIDAARPGVVGEADTRPDAHAVALAGAPSRVFVANRGAGTVTVLDARTLARVDELRVAKLPTHLLTLPGDRLLVSDGASKSLVIVDPATLEVLDEVALPFQPHQSAASGR